MSEQHQDRGRTEDRRIEEEQEAQEHFYRELITFLRAFLAAIRRLRRDRVEEIIQKTLLTVWQELPPQLRGADKTEQRQAWVATVARNRAVDLIRRLRRHRTQSLDALLAEPIDRRSEMCEKPEEEERRRELLEAAMKELREDAPDRYRLLHARYFENRSVKDLAEAEGLTPRQLSSRLYRILVTLREWVSRHRGDGPTSS